MARRPRKREPRLQSYKLYIRRMLEEVHPGLTISTRALAIMNSFVCGSLDDIMTEATRIADKDRRKTVTIRDMEFAVRLCLPGDLAESTKRKATKVITKFKATVRPRRRGQKPNCFPM